MSDSNFLKPILNAPFSFFTPPITNVVSSESKTLQEVYEYIKGDSALTRTESLRAKAPSERRAFKSQVFANVTFSGIFIRRSDEQLTHPTGYICIDLDHVASNIKDLRKIMARLKDDAQLPPVLMFVSPGGDGVKLVYCYPIPLDNDIVNIMHAHTEAFRRITDYLENTYNLVTDKAACNLSRCCFLPWDKEAFFNASLDHFPSLLLEGNNADTRPVDGTSYVPSNNTDNAENVIIPSLDKITQNHDYQHVDSVLQKIERHKLDITADYHDWIRLGFAFYHTFGDDGLLLFRRVSQFHPEYTENMVDRKFAELRKHDRGTTTIGTFFDIAKRHGVNVSYPMPKAPDAITVLAPSDLKDYDEDADVDLSDLQSELPCFPEEIYPMLPEFLQECVTVAKSPQEKDMLLLGCMDALSSCLPNLVSYYGDVPNFPNFYAFVNAPAASGKGRIEFCRQLVLPIHQNLRHEYLDQMEHWTLTTANMKVSKDDLPPEPKNKMLLIPIDNSATGFAQNLDQTAGCGLCFETEGDTLNAVLKTDYGNYSTMLRKAFHHEMISYNRRSKNEYVELSTPKLSLLFCGTPTQVTNLMGDGENGLFSRFVFYSRKPKIAWHNQFPGTEGKVNLLDFYRHLGERFFPFHIFLRQLPQPMVYVFPDSFAERFNGYFEKLLGQFVELCGETFAPSVYRMGTIVVRMSMIFTALRLMNQQQTGAFKFECDQESFYAATLMCKTLLIHAAAIYNYLPREKAKVLDTHSKNFFYSVLPYDFNREFAISLGLQLKITENTIDNRLKSFVEKGLLEKIDAHNYHKTKK
jgi:hypothetical protein